MVKLGLSEDGLRAKIQQNKYKLTESESIDLFFIYPTLVELEWKKGNVVLANIKGLNLDFKVSN